MNGILLIDKPAGPTSHDVVARIRHVTGERRVGHTGTLDPLATGLLPLVLGRATRLASLLTGGEKTYDATVRLGFATETDDAEGAPLSPPAATALPDDAALLAALQPFRGTYEQLPPRHSAKKVGGRRAYDLARRDQPVELRAVSVTVHELELQERSDAVVKLRVRCGSGFYVRSLARDLGECLGCGGHLAALRRVASGTFTVADAIPLDEAERLGAELASRVIAPAAALPGVEAVTVTAAGEARVRHGNPIGPEHLTSGMALAGPSLLRVLGADGALLALARPRGGALHPMLVLG